jgi:hypothetical protein
MEEEMYQQTDSKSQTFIYEDLDNTEINYLDFNRGETQLNM